MDTRNNIQTICYMRSAVTQWWIIMFLLSQREQSRRGQQHSSDDHTNQRSRTGDLAPRGHLARSGDICGSRNWCGSTDSRVSRPGMLLNLLPCTQQPPASKDHLAPNVSRAGLRIKQM